MKLRPMIGILLLAAASQSCLAAAPRIGVLLKDRDLFWAAVGKGAEEAGRATGAEVIIKAPVVANAVAQQQMLLAALEKEHLDALVIGPLTQADFSKPVASLKAKGVKVVVLETPLDPGIGDVYLGYNQAEMAETASRLFVTAVRDGDEIAMIRANSLERFSLREKTLIAKIREFRPKSALDVDIMVGAQKGDDLDQCLLLLATHPNIKAVCTPFSACSIAMIKALEQKRLGGKIPHLGFGTALPPEAEHALTSGNMFAWIAQRPKSFGQKGVEAAIALVKGESVPPVIDVDYAVVTKDNLQDPKIQALKD
jgi:ribose transport system substrate-binding protein